ncbi:hypothetical protein GY45DRAFT_1302958 [Cubamyces sp. BRFM 1775]|nr:hypothetical protein GY45DRAFT_1302958 [Cubamyces sp. BRFM 1775]
MLYEHLRYVVRFGGESTEAFQALMGILIGDPASPMLWLLFLADFELEPHPDDIYLDGERVDHLEQADDMAFMSLSAEGMQSKLAQVERYCSITFLHVNVIKTLASVHGPIPDPLPPLSLYGRELTYVDSTTYVGMTFTTTQRDIFRDHYHRKAEKARNASNATLSLESYTGPLPPSVVLTLYRTHIDPHLTAGCEVALDVRPNALADLEDVQRTYLRRALNISRRSQVAPLYCETGIWPIAYRRLQLAVKYLVYILETQPLLVRAALYEQWHLTTLHQASSWWGDLLVVAAHLPVPIHIPCATRPTLETMRSVLEHIPQSLAQHLCEAIMASRRLPLLQHRIHRASPPHSAPALKVVCDARPYLYLPQRRQREAVTRLLFSEHPFAVEQLRRAPAPRPIPRERRVCRFCTDADAIEDEAHMLLRCPAPALRTRRDEFLHAAITLHPPLRRLRDRLADEAFLDVLLNTECTLAATATYVADVLATCETVPLLIVNSDEELRALQPRYQL